MTLTLLPKEIEAVERLCEGWNYPQIARKTGRSERTIEKHIANAKQRNDISTTIHLCVMWAKQRAKT